MLDSDGLRAPTHGPNGGVADILDEAKAAFRGGMGRGRLGPLPEKADVECSGRLRGLMTQC